MLVLSRKAQESVVVSRAENSDLLMTVTVIEIKGRHVRLGFVADGAIAIHRWELWEKLRVGPAESNPLQMVAERLEEGD
jgi:carbon storage regulator CsrA